MDAQTIAAVGGTLSVLLSINAFFTSNLLKTLKRLEVELAKLATQHDRVLLDVENLMTEQERTKRRLHDLEGRPYLKVDDLMELLKHTDK